MKTKIMIKFKNTLKRVYINIYTSELFIKHDGKQLKCKWVDNNMEVDGYGLSLVF